MVNKLKRLDGATFEANKREVDCPRERNNYDCGIYVILMIEKIIRNLKENKCIETIGITQEEVDGKREELKNKIRENKEISTQVKVVEDEGKNEAYIKELGKRVGKYPTVDKITLDNEEEGSLMDIKRTEEEAKEIYKMTEKLLKKEKVVNKNLTKNEKEESEEIEVTTKRITRSMTNKKEESKKEIKSETNQKGKRNRNRKSLKNLKEEIENSRIEKEYRNTIKGIPEEAGKIDLEVMLINIRSINADKVQQIVEGFLTRKDYISIFCLTETQVKSIGFKTQGIKMHTKERGVGEKKGGGLAIGYIENKMIELEEIDTGSNDVMVLEGLIYGENARIILTYMDCSKMKSGKNYEHNRKIQKIIEKWIEVEPGTMLVCLGDFNARMRELEPRIRQSDENGKMIEEWVMEKGLHHLNQQPNCRGLYTFGKSEKAKSAIDHVLVNTKMSDCFRGMRVDENAEELNISDHNLIRSWNH